MASIRKEKKTTERIRTLIVLFPLINIVSAFLLKGDGLLTVYTIFSVLVFLLYIISKSSGKKGTIRKNEIYIFLTIILISIVHVTLDLSSVEQIIIFDFAIIYWTIYSKREDGKSFLDWMLTNEKKVVLIEGCYFVFLLLSVISGNGMSTEAWGTTTLKGPYSINHVLAYEVFCFSLFNLVIWIKKNKKMALVYYSICFAIIILTGVRSTIIVLFLAFSFAYFTKKLSSKIFIIICGAAIISFLAFNTNLFVGVVEKTQNAAALGSVSSSRGAIFLSSLRALTTSNNPLYWIFGMGQDNLTLFNRYSIFMTIHAHNDFIDALVQYGIIGLITYLVSFIKVCGKSTKAILIIGILAFTNGYYMYQCVVITTPLIIAFCEATKRVKSENTESKGILRFSRKKAYE